MPMTLGHLASKHFYGLTDMRILSKKLDIHFRRITISLIGAIGALFNLINANLENWVPLGGYFHLFSDNSLGRSIHRISR